jgi:signal transduction histidine kinase
MVPRRKRPPVLAEAADVLSGHLQPHLRRLGCLLLRCDGLEDRFEARLSRLGYGTLERRALAAVTPDAAARILAAGKPPEAFFEQVAYSGRRLAKLNVPPGAVLEALREYDHLLDGALAKLAPEDNPNLVRARQQLHFCGVLTLNNAFYQVREAEARVFLNLSRAELESRGQPELLERSLAVLAQFCEAQAGRIFLLDETEPRWVPMAAWPEPGEHPPQRPARGSREMLSRPRHLEMGRRSGWWVLDPAWGRRYPSCWSIPFCSTGRKLAGVMQFAFEKRYEWLPRELELLSAAADRLLIASEKARLMEDLTRREEQVRRLAAHMLQVEEAERHRISRELHDETGQLLLCLRLQLELLERSVPAHLGELQAGLAGARGWVEQTITGIRRVLADLSPAVLEQLGLEAALRQLVSRFRRLHPAEVRLQMSRLSDLPPKTGTVVYRLVQECCSNIARHSSASEINISLTAADGTLRLRVADDGVGFDVKQALAKRGSFGLAGMRERVALVGGTCEITSRPGQGATITVELPAGAGDAAVARRRLCTAQKRYA